MSQRRSATKSDSPVAAREALNQQAAAPPGPTEEAAKEQEKQQAAELRDGGKLSSAERKASKVHQDLSQEAPAAARAAVPGDVHTKGGFMDQASRRSAADALEGHFVRIDLNDKGVQAAYKEAFPQDKFPDGHQGDYGVFMEPALRDPVTGIPITAVVRLRDDTNARLTVPYEALRPAQAGGR